MRRELVCSTCAIVLMSVATAAADSAKIKGQYAFTGAGSCLWAPGFSPTPTNPTPGVALANSGFCTGPNTPDPGCVDGHPRNIGPTGKNFSTTFAVEGIRTFNGDGTGTAKGSALTLTVPPTPGPPTEYPHFPPSASRENFSFDFTYTVNDDGSWTSDVVPGSFNTTHVRGPRTEQTSTI